MGRFENQRVPRTAPGRRRYEKVGDIWSHLGRKWHQNGRHWEPLGAENGTKSRKMPPKKASEDRAKIDTKSKNAGKLHAEIDATNCYFSKGAKNQKHRSKVRF